MDVTVAASGPCRKTLTIKIPPEQVRTHIDEVYRAAAQQVRLKGFRPGKVPRKMLEQRLGGDILAEAKQSLVTKAFQDALRDQKLAPLGQPKLEGLDDKPLDASAALEYQVQFDVRPEIELGTVRGLECSRGDPAVNDADIQSALVQLAEQKRALRPIDEAARDGDFLKMDLTFRGEQGEVVHERKGVQLTASIPVAGTDPSAFAGALRGAEKGHQAKLELTFPPTFEKEAVRGQKGAVELHVHQVLRVTPAAIDDELAKAYDHESLAALQDDLRHRLGEEKARANRLRQEDDLLQQLLAAHPFDLPASMVEDQAQLQLQDIERRIREQNQGADDEAVKKQLAELEPEVRQRAERAVRMFFLIDAVARKEKVFVTEGDIEAEIRAIAQLNNTSQQAVREHFEEQHLLPQVRLNLVERKVREVLRQHAQWTD